MIYLADPDVRTVEYSEASDGAVRKFTVCNGAALTDSGYVSVTFDSAVPQNASIVPLMKSLKAVSLFKSYCDGKKICMMYWIADLSEPLVFSLENCEGLKIVKVETGF